MRDLRDWRAEALCLSAPSLQALFAATFDKHSDAEEEARRVCCSCPVAMQCFRAAMEDPREGGMRAGTTERQRRRARARRARRRARQAATLGGQEQGRIA